MHAQGRRAGAAAIVALPGIGQMAAIREDLDRMLTQEEPLLDLGHERAGDAAQLVVADDQPDAAYSLGLVPGMHGHQVRTALDGTEAQAVARSWQPDATVLDIGMPGATGDAVASPAREQPRAAKAQPVAVTGWGRPEDRTRLRAVGFDEHLVKPVAIEDLLAALDQGRD